MPLAIPWMVIIAVEAVKEKEKGKKKNSLRKCGLH